MVAGLLKFKEYFKDYADSYVLIGGAACDILFTENGFSVLRPEYLILFKAKAYLDLSSRKAQGEKVDSADIKKHKKDVLRLAVEMVLNPISDLPESVMEDIHHFINNLREDEYDQNSLKTYRVTNDQVVSRLVSVFEA